jgi:hypothetical protein
MVLVTEIINSCATAPTIPGRQRHLQTRPGIAKCPTHGSNQLV